MIEWMAICLSTLLILLTVYDVIITVISHSGAGPITRTWTRYAWRLVLRLKYKLNWERPMYHMGPLFVISILIVWYLLLHIGFSTLLYFGGEFTHINKGSVTLGPKEILYFVGSTFSTLGLGDFTPSKFPWTVVTTTGAIIVSLLTTLFVSYVIPILSAVTERRKLISAIDILGKNPKELLSFAWGPESSGELDDEVLSLTNHFIEESYKTYVYPVLGYFYFRDQHSSLNGAILNLFDALVVQLLKPDRVGNMSSVKINYLIRSIEVYVKNLRRECDRLGLDHEVRHLPFEKLLKDFSIDIESVNKGRYDDLLSLRSHLIVFAYYEGRCTPKENGIIEK